jgi:ankyrin repeat protein
MTTFEYAQLKQVVSQGQTDKARELLNRSETRSGVLQESDSQGNTLLHWGVLNGQRECVRMLLDRGAHVNAKNKMGYTSAHLAAEKGLVSILSLLISRDADLSSEPMSILTVAILNDKLPSALLCLKFGAALSLNRADLFCIYGKHVFPPLCNEDRLLSVDTLIVARAQKIEQDLVLKRAANWSRRANFIMTVSNVLRQYPVSLALKSEDDYNVKSEDDKDVLRRRLVLQLLSTHDLVRVIVSFI